MLLPTETVYLNCKQHQKEPVTPLSTTGGYLLHFDIPFWGEEGRGTTQKPEA